MFKIQLTNDNGNYILNEKLVTNNVKLFQKPKLVQKNKNKVNLNLFLEFVNRFLFFFVSKK